MKVAITKRADGTFRAGHYMPKHHGTGLPFGGDEIIAEKVFDIPSAYETAEGIAWDGSHIMEHPSIRAWITRA